MALHWLRLGFYVIKLRKKNTLLRFKYEPLFIHNIERQLCRLVTFDCHFSFSITIRYSIDHTFVRQFKSILNALDYWCDK